MTYVPRRPMHIVTAEELEQINKELIRAAWYQGLADSRKNAGRSR